MNAYAGASKTIKGWDLYVGLDREAGTITHVELEQSDVDAADLTPKVWAEFAMEVAQLIAKMREAAHALREDTPGEPRLPLDFGFDDVPGT